MRDYHCICDQCRTVFVPMDMCICICLQWPNFSHRSCKYEDYPAWGNIGLYLRGIEVCHQQHRFHGIAGEESFQCQDHKRREGMGVSGDPFAALGLRSTGANVSMWIN